MIKIDSAVFPSPEQWEAVIVGMRNPKNSWDKNDSGYCDWYLIEHLKGQMCHEGSCPIYSETVKVKPTNMVESCTGYVLGENDLKLMKILCQSGSPEHAKFLRQLPVIIDVSAPLYWWKQMDQYKVGTVTDSCSTMHKLTDKTFEETDFSFDHLKEISEEEAEDNLYFIADDYKSWWGPGLWANEVDPPTFKEVYEIQIIQLLNALRHAYLKTGDRKYWNAINELLPQSYMQKRTWSANYEVLRTICKQRKGHPLQEWNSFIEWVHENVPFSKQLIFNEWETE